MDAFPDSPLVGDATNQVASTFACHAKVEVKDTETFEFISALIIYSLPDTVISGLGSSSLEQAENHIGRATNKIMRKSFVLIAVIYFQLFYVKKGCPFGHPFIYKPMSLVYFLVSVTGTNVPSSST